MFYSGKKKTYHICFYTEVGEIMTDLGKSSHMYDRVSMEYHHVSCLLQRIIVISLGVTSSYMNNMA